MDDQNKNLILATVLSFLVILVWFLMFPPEQTDPALQPDAVAATDGAPAITPEAAPAAVQATDAAPEATAVASALRIPVATPSLSGSISLAGGRIDDLLLTGYHETIDPSSPNVRLLSPVGGEAKPYYTLHGWVPSAGLTADQVPGPDTLWTLAEGDTLTPDSPVTIAWDNGTGLSFRRTISVDDKFMFTIRQEVTNSGAAPVTLTPYGLVARHGDPDTVNFFILHEGVVRMSDGTLEEIEYDDLPDLDRDDSRVEVQETGWTGFTDKYWMTTLIPDAGAFRSVARHAADIYRIETLRPSVTVAPGETASSSERVFAGAKEWETIRAYENQGGVAKFIDSIDWGWFFFLTKPIFAVLHWLHGFIGNMGWSIIALTFLLKAVLFPLAYKSYASMAKMRELQPQMEKLKEAAGDDREKLQKNMMELYKKEKVNPASGCLPILLQIPIFFSLYKVIFVTIELRHAPWIGWIKDLSAPDPSSILNLFGLLPWAPEPAGFLSIIALGILPILLGISMYLQQKLNPAPPDPTQRMIFAWMPWVFMFMLGGFASGLVIYWITNNTITFIQQFTIMRMHGYHPDILGNIRGNPHEHMDKKTK
ncbi:MAG: membrane protein insertase YidC [Rhodobacterales bacterium]|nr:MAG: membrane protein insertase YidC [Rhodobacterales bacterium]